MKTTLDRLPEVYLQESRDFQLLARLWNMLYIAGHWKAKCISSVLDPIRCPEQYLDWLSDRLGFRPTIDIAPSDMRIILAVFPWLIRNKGSVRAINTATRIALLLQGLNPTAIKILVLGGSAEITIATDVEFDTAILAEILRYVAPVGFVFSTIRATSSSRNTVVSGDDWVFVATASTKTLSSVKNNYTDEIMESITLASGSELKSGTYIASGSTGVTVGTTTSDITLNANATLKSGSKIKSESTIILTADRTLSSDITLASRSVLKSDTEIAADSTGTDIASHAGTTIASDITLTADATLKSGSVIKSESKLVLNGDRAIGTYGYGESLDTWAVGTLGIQEITSIEDGVDAAEGTVSQIVGQGELPTE